MDRHLVEQLGLRSVTEQFHGANETQINEIEVNLAVRLPQDYKNFLKQYGASLFTEDVVFRPIEPSPWAVNGNECFDMFYGISANAGSNICRVNARLEGDIPDGTIAIGHDSGSNLILLSAETNQVRFFDKDTGKTYLIAPSFEEFLKSFRLRH